MRTLEGKIFVVSIKAIHRNWVAVDEDDITEGIYYKHLPCIALASSHEEAARRACESPSVVARYPEKDGWEVTAIAIETRLDIQLTKAGPRSLDVNVDIKCVH